jgi:hypothetical protein
MKNYQYFIIVNFVLNKVYQFTYYMFMFRYLEINFKNWFLNEWILNNNNGIN